MNKRGSLGIGLILITIGVLWFLANMKLIDLSIFDLTFIISKFWPALFLMIPGVLFHYAYFFGTNKDAGLLVPGGILFVIGLTCQLSLSFSIWHLMWPGYILSVAVGLFELYLFGKKEKGLLIPVAILGGLSVIFFTSFSFRWLLGFDMNRLIVPVILILLGLIIILKPSVKENNK